MAFGRAFEGVDDAAAHQTKIAGVDGDGNFGDAFDCAIENASGEQLERALAFARSAHGIDDVVALAIFREEGIDEFGRVL